MKSTYNLNAHRYSFIAVLVLFILPVFLSARTIYRSTSANITISVTSSLHDWSEKTNAGTAAATFIINNNKITGLSNLMFTVPAKSLKSEHKAMDNNTYKALKTDKHARRKQNEYVHTSHCDRTAYLETYDAYRYIF